MTNPASILDLVKKSIGFDSSYTAFDIDVTMQINAAFGSLQQLGVGPSTGFFISDNTALWTDFTSRADMLGMVQAFMVHKVRLAFDPPASGFALTAIAEQITQLEQRILLANETIPQGIDTGGIWWILDGLSDFPLEAKEGDWGIDLGTGDVFVKDVLHTIPDMWDLTECDEPFVEFLEEEFGFLRPKRFGFPRRARIGEFGFNSITGDVWRKTA